MRKLWIAGAVVAAVLAAAASIAAVSALNDKPAPVAAAASPTPAATTPPAVAGLTRVEVCSDLIDLNAQAALEFFAHGLARDTGRSSIRDTAKVEGIATGYMRLEQRGPSEMAAPIMLIERSLLEIAREAAGGQRATYKYDDVSSAFDSLDIMCGHPTASPAVPSR